MPDGAAQQVDGRALGGVELGTFTADEGMALLGGAELAPLLAARTAAPLDAAATAQLQAALTGEGQWLFAAEPRRWLLEVLRTKLRTFAVLVDGVVGAHRTGRPHPGIGDGPWGFLLDGQASAAPARWRLRPAAFGPVDTAVAVDRPALGMRLVRLLLVDDEQPLAAAAEGLARCVRRLGEEATATRLDARAVSARARQLLGARDLRACWEPLHLLHRRIDRDRVAGVLAAEGSLLDDGLWQRVLLLALRLLATDPQFGFAAAADDSEPLAPVVAELAAIEQRLHVALFAHAERDRLLELACGARHGALAGAAAGAEDPEAAGFHLTVKKGEAVVQQLHFTQDRVTIGRREGENLLRLNDAMVSSAHAILERTPEGWCVMDRNSTNGTEVDGIRLPGEVPQPLQDGSQIQIRPFTLVFRSAVASTDVATLGPAAGADELWEQLQDAFAAAAAEPVAREQALQEVLAHAETRLGPMRLLQQLDALGRHWRRAADGTSDAGSGGLAVASLRAVDQLSRALLGTGEFRSPADVQAFVGKLGRFVETTSQWIERTLELRKVLGKHLELGFGSTGTGTGGRAPVRTAADVRQSALGWDGVDALAADPSAYFLARFYDELVAILVGLLQGNQQIRRAVRERLDPDRLVEAVSREAKVRLLVQATAGSALWKAYVQAYQELTDGGSYEAELEQLLQRALADRSAP